MPKTKKKDHRVWVSQPGSGLDKRQCTLQICFSPEYNKVSVGIIFRGTGKRVTEEERAAYHKSVDIYWQKCAWADTQASVDWVRNTLASAVENLPEFVLFCDNLSAQTFDQFLSGIKALNGIVWFGVQDATDIWQPVDMAHFTSD